MEYTTIPQMLNAGILRYAAERKSTLISRWLIYEKFEIYLRTGSDCAGFDEARELVMLPTIVISNIIVYPQFQNQGVFRELLANLIADGRKMQYARIKVEQVHNPILYAYLERQGFKHLEFETLYLDIGE